MPKPWLPDVRLVEGPKIGMHVGIKMNPDYYEFKAEIKRVTGHGEIYVIMKDDQAIRREFEKEDE